MTIPVFHKQVTLAETLLRSEIENVNIRNMLSRLPDREDVIELLIVLEETCKFQQHQDKPLLIDYFTFKALGQSNRVHEFFRSRWLRPELFWRLSKIMENEQVSLCHLIGVLTGCITRLSLSWSLSLYSVGDPFCESITSIDTLEDWLYMMSSNIYQVQKMSEQFLPLWIFTAAHTISFFHGKQHSSKLSVPSTDRMSTVATKIQISHFVESDTMKQLMSLRNDLVEEMELNIFSRIRAVRYYDAFTVFESAAAATSRPTQFSSAHGRIDEEVFVSPIDTCCILNGGYMNPVFMERLLEAHTGGSPPPLDYRKFLGFAIAWDNRKTAAGVQYFWPVLDRSQKRYLTIPDLEPLVEGIVGLIHCLPSMCGPQGVSATGILMDEIVDLFTLGGVNSANSLSILLTYEQAVAFPNVFGTVIGILGNTQTFIEYECREDTAHKQFIAKQMKDAANASKKLRTNANSRAAQLQQLQKVIDNAWFADSVSKPQHASFADFLDYHESIYGGQAMEPLLNEYYLWEAAEMEQHQLLLDSQLGACDESEDNVCLRE